MGISLGSRLSKEALMPSKFRFIRNEMISYIACHDIMNRFSSHGYCMMGDHNSSTICTGKRN